MYLGKITSTPHKKKQKKKQKTKKQKTFLLSYDIAIVFDCTFHIEDVRLLSGNSALFDKKARDDAKSSAASFVF